MTNKEDLEKYIDTYNNDIYERENLLTIANYYQKCINYSPDKESLLELGIGHGLNLKKLQGVYKRATIVEGSKSLVLKYQNFDKNYDIMHSYFEDFQTKNRYSVISMGFVLEHVDDPYNLLINYKKYLNSNGVIYVGVPNAMSLHRIIGNKAGFLDDIKQMSEADRAFGHKRFLTNNEWLELFSSAGYKVSRNEGLYLKPVTTQQLETLKLDANLYDALCASAMDFPSISNSCFYELRPEM